MSAASSSLPKSSQEEIPESVMESATLLRVPVGPGVGAGVVGLGVGDALGVSVGPDVGVFVGPELGNCIIGATDAGSALQ